MITEEFNNKTQFIDYKKKIFEKENKGQIEQSLITHITIKI